jgi:hypothetical protein
MHKNVNLFLDIPFRGPQNDHFRLLAAIYLKLWSQLCSMLNIAHRQVTAYHPVLNGALERLHRHASRMHSAHALLRQLGPMSYLLYSSVFELSRREDTGLSPAESIFGAPIVLPNEFLQSDELAVDSIISSCFFFAQAQFQLQSPPAQRATG